MLSFFQILGQADPNGLAIVVFMMKVFVIVFCIAALLAALIPIVLFIYLIFKLVTCFTRKECKNCKRRIPKSYENCNYCGAKMN